MYATGALGEGQLPLVNQFHVVVLIATSVDIQGLQAKSQNELEQVESIIRRTDEEQPCH